MHIKISLIIILSIISFSQSLVSNYVPIIGRDLNNPADITRAALTTYLNANDALSYSKGFIYEIPGDVFNITFSKFYLNNIISLSASDTFGALSHYNSLIGLYNNLNNISLVGLNNTIIYINTISKFANLDATKFDPITASINNLKSSIDSIMQSTTIFATAMNTTKNSLSPSTPNVATVQVVKDNYDLVIKSVLSIFNHLDSMKYPLNNMLSLMPTCKEEVEFYLDSLTSDDDYMANMKSYMTTFLKFSNILYERSLLFTKLKEFF
ncbi:hypothetical protein ACTA71_011817 [Dictyostelium dimigraforme]